MGRMFSRDKGKSGSTKPAKPAIPSWTRYKDTEIKMLVTKLAKEGKSMAEIGIIMRDSYGIPSIKLIASKSLKNPFSLARRPSFVKSKTLL